MEFSPQPANALADAIAQMPADWALTPCVGKKNLWPNWPAERLDRNVLIEAVRSQTNKDGKYCAWTGISVVTGSLSDGLMAVDFDGPTALGKYLELSGGEAPPETLRWTSGKNGHFQILLDVPPEKWSDLNPRKIELPNGDKLELRWNQCSTLPPSVHPDTGKPYYWEKHDCAIAECPDWILDLMRTPALTTTAENKPQHSLYISGEKSLVDLLEQEILPRLDPAEFYGEWVKLKPSGKNLKGLCPFHAEKTGSFTVTPESGTYHCFGCGAGGGPVQFLHQIRGGSGSPTGKDFAGVVGTVLGGRVGIELKKGYSVKDSHIEYPIFFTADIGHPSTGKSATQGTLVEPLQEMQDGEQERLGEALMELEQLTDAWKSMPKDEKAEKADSDENPRIFEAKYCKPKKWLLDEASAQALTKRISEQAQNHGCLLLQDELAGLFDSLDQFTGGKGGQRQFLLKAWNKPLRGSVDRVDLNASYFFKSQTLSLTGTIQPAVAKKIFNVASDPDGMLSRFLPAIASIPDNFARRPTARVNVYGAIKGLIEGLQRLPETLLTLPARTADIFWNHWEDLRRGQDSNFDSNPAYSYFLGKQISYTGRFAIVIHCLDNMDAARLPTEVSAETMNKAVRLSLFYCSQFLLLQSKSAQRQPIEGILLDILKFVQQRGGQISTRELYHSRFKRVEVEGKKFNAYLADKFLTAIADAGYGTFQNKVFTSLETNWRQTGDTSGDTLNQAAGKALNPAWRQIQKPYILENTELRTETISERLIDESASELSSKIENTYFVDLSPQAPQTQTPKQSWLSPPLSPPVSSEVEHALSALEMAVLDEDKFLVDRICECFPPEILREASVVLGKRSPEMKKLLADWVAQKKLADQLLSAVRQPASFLEKIIASHPPDKILAACDRLRVTNFDAAQKLSDLLAATDNALAEKFQQIASLEDFQDFADWLEDPAQLEKLVEMSENPQIKLWWGQMQD